MAIWKTIAVAVVSGLALLACSDPAKSNGEQGLDCLTSADCGGSVDGTWAIENACPTVHTPQMLACSGATQTVKTVHATGTVEFMAGVSKWNVSDSLSAALDVPNACAPSGCEALAASVQASASKDVQSAMVTCTPAQSACACQLSTMDTDNAIRAYTLSGNTISFSDTSRALGYCAVGDQLRLRGPTETLLFTRVAP